MLRLEELPKKIKDMLCEIIQLLHGKSEEKLEKFDEIKEKIFEDYSKFAEYLRQMEPIVKFLNSRFEDALKFFGFLMDTASIAKNLSDVDDPILLRFLVSSLLESLLHVNDVVSESFRRLDELEEFEAILNRMLSDTKNLMDLFQDVKEKISEQVDYLRDRLEELNEKIHEVKTESK